MPEPIHAYPTHMGCVICDAEATVVQQIWPIDDFVEGTPCWLCDEHRSPDVKVLETRDEYEAFFRPVLNEVKA